VLKDRLRALKPETKDADLDLDAYGVWSAIHGLATVRGGDAVSFLQFGREQQAAADQHAMDMIELAAFRVV